MIRALNVLFVAAFAQVLLYRTRELNVFGDAPTPVLDAMFSLKEPKTGTDGTMSWTVDVLNPRTGESLETAVRLFYLLCFFSQKADCKMKN